jgi:hypothetical protein
VLQSYHLPQSCFFDLGQYRMKALKLHHEIPIHPLLILAHLGMLEHTLEKIVLVLGVEE